MINESILNLDITLEYLNTGKMVNPITILSETVIKESYQFDSYFNEGAKEIGTKIKSAIDTIIQKIKDFIKWIKDKVIELLDKVKKFFSKQKARFVEDSFTKLKRTGLGESVLFEKSNTVDMDAIDKLLDKKIPVSKKLTVERLIDMVKEVDSVNIDDVTEKDIERINTLTEKQANIYYIGDNVSERDRLDIRTILSDHTFTKIEQKIAPIMKIIEISMKEWDKEIKFYEKELKYPDYNEMEYRYKLEATTKKMSLGTSVYNVLASYCNHMYNAYSACYAVFKKSML